MSAIVERARGHIEELSHDAVERYRAEIADYAAGGTTLLDGEGLSVTRRSFGMLLRRLEHEQPPRPDALDELRRAFARRVTQDVSLTSIQQACRIGCECLWESILRCASLGERAEREGALGAASTWWSHVSLVATIATEACLDAAETVEDDRQIVRRHLL